MSRSELRGDLDYPESDVSPKHTIWETDATNIPIPNDSADLVFTSPPYWQKRDYEHIDQIGQETTVDGYIRSLIECFAEWERVLRPTGSIMLNIGDSYRNKSRAGVPWRLAQAARDHGWRVRSEIVWQKPNGMPTPADDRFKNRHEYIFQFTPKSGNHYFDQFGFEEVYDEAVDVWEVSHDNQDLHLAPFPEELVERALVAACPPTVCKSCGEPRERIVEKSVTQLNPDRPQARRAMERYEQSDLTKKHLRAVQATGISDIGKGKQVQNGSGENSEEVVRLAREAKEVLGGYFREFTFPIKTTTGWTSCNCDDKETVPGMVVDPFAGSGTTIEVAEQLGFSAVGTDIKITDDIRDALAVEVIQ